jgi:glutamyl-tRNA synthetase
VNHFLSTADFSAPRTGGVRFAPSPTGHFHLGNLRTAWISFRIAKSLGLPWVVRMEDIDRPRVLPEAQDSQLADMKKIGLTPDVLLLQSHYFDRHWQLFSDAARSGQLYPCDCSRKEVQSALASIASAPHDGLAPVYSGHCRPLGLRTLKPAESIAWRFRMPSDSGIEDFIVARTGAALNENGIPDRATFVPAYHWACAIDDADGGYDLLVRSIDLFPAARIQRAIQSWMANHENRTTQKVIPVFHTSLVVDHDDHRLEKRTRGVTLAELEKAGVSPSDVVELFERSFDAALLMPERLRADAQESRTRIRLDEMGF